MSPRVTPAHPSNTRQRELSLYHLLDPAVLSNPYPLYRRLREEDPVHWDPFLHAWVVTRYADVLTALQHCSVNRIPSSEYLQAIGLEMLIPVTELMASQMLFLDAPAHTRIRRLATKAFTPRHVHGLRDHITTLVDGLLDAALPTGGMDIVAGLASQLPAIVIAELLGLPLGDAPQLKEWSQDFAMVLGNFQHEPDRVHKVAASVRAMVAYFSRIFEQQRRHPAGGLISAFLSTDIDGDILSDTEVMANTILTMVGGQETTTNLIGNGILTLLRHPDQLALLRCQPDLIASAVEEVLRFESPSQQTMRVAPEDMELGGKVIKHGQTVLALTAAANRDPERFPDPDVFDIQRSDNRHLAFGWAAHFCFGSPLARLEGEIALGSAVARLPHMRLADAPIEFRANLSLRGLKELHVTFDALSS